MIGIIGGRRRDTTTNASNIIYKFFIETATVACTRGFEFVAKFSCKRGKHLQSRSRIFNTLYCGAIKFQAILMMCLEVAEVI